MCLLQGGGNLIFLPSCFFSLSTDPCKNSFSVQAEKAQQGLLPLLPLLVSVFFSVLSGSSRRVFVRSPILLLLCDRKRKPLVPPPSPDTVGRIRSRLLRFLFPIVHLENLHIFPLSPHTEPLSTALSTARTTYVMRTSLYRALCRSINATRDFDTSSNMFKEALLMWRL